MPKRNYKWLFASLAVLGLTLDLASKYYVFKWLYNDGQTTSDGKFDTWTIAEPWHPDDSDHIVGGRYNLVPGWFGFTAEYIPGSKPCDCSFHGLQSWSAPLMPRVNQGALFGMGGDHKGLANRIFAAISILAAAGIVIWAVRKGREMDGWMTAALGLILGGTLGNLFDRIVFNGVRDFLYFYKIKWPVFNVADCCLVCGAIMLLVHAFLIAPPENAAKSEPAPAPTPPSA